MKKRLIRVAAAALAALTLCTGCGSTAYETSSPDYTIGVVLKTQSSEYWLRIRAGMERAAKEENIQLKISWPTDELATLEQRDMIADMLRCEIDALVVTPCDSWDCGWFRDEAAARGIPVFTADTAALDCDLPYIGSNPEKIGRTAAEYMHQNLPAGSRVGTVTGSRRQQSLTARTGAFRDAIQTDGSLVLAGVEDDCLVFASALEAARKLIAEDTDALFCTSAVLGLGAAAAVREAGADVRIVAVDTQDDALKAVETGAFDALITQSGEELGYKAIQTVVQSLEGEEIPAETYISGEVLTADNIAAFLTKQREEDETWSGS